MPRIVAIKPAPRRKERWRLEFDDGTESVEFTTDALARSGLGVGDEVDAARWAAVLREAQFDACRQKAWDLVARKHYAEAELVAALRRGRFGRAIIDEVVGRIRELGYINDAALARRVVEQGAASTSSPRGPHLMRRQLANKGLDDEVIESALAEVVTNESQSASARAALERWARSHKPAGSSATASAKAESHKRRQAAAAFLFRRGFDAEVVWEVVRAVLAAGDED